MPNVNRLPRVALFAIAGATLGCQPNEPQPIIGYVEADWLYVAAPDAGWLTTVEVEEGDIVAVGDLLFTLDDQIEQAATAEALAKIAEATARAKDLGSGARREELLTLKARLREAEALLQRAEANYARTMPLVEQGIEPSSRGDDLKAERDSARANTAALREDIRVAELAGRSQARAAAGATVESAQAAWQQSELRLNERTVTARRAGRVETTILSEGEFATMGAPVLAMLPDEGLMVRFYVPQAQLTDISVGQSVRIQSDGTSTAISVTVSRIATEAEFTPPVIYTRDMREKLVFLVEATLPKNSSLKPGLPVEVSW
ncbi:MAG: HlyD family efflux transporter periplasmic adaptor subunit [Pseudomonadota bacterium]